MKPAGWACGALAAWLACGAPAVASPAGAAMPASAEGANAPRTPAPLNLNRATPAQVRALPIPREVADAIIHHRTYRAWFTSFYELMEVPGMTPELLRSLRPLVSVSPVFEQEYDVLEVEERRALELEEVIQRFLSEEGSSEGLVDVYVDQIKDPPDLNSLDYFDLTAYQNVSPVDAVAILRERRQGGRIENARQLRNSEGLSYWGFRNLRDFVRYDPPGGPLRLHGDYQMRLYNTPYTVDDEDILLENILGDTQGLSDADAAGFRNFDLNTYAGRLDLDAARPAQTHKLRLRLGVHGQGALMTHRNLGEEGQDATVKGFVGVRDLPARPTLLGTFKLHAAVLGSYTLAFGQGLVMDATDFFLPRRTGMGYSVRAEGVRGDASRTDEFALRGGALEASLGRVRGTFFYSRDDKDAVLNPDGSFHQYITMVPRVSNGLLEGIRRDIQAGVFAGRGDTAAFLPMRDVMDEQVMGGNLKLEAGPGTYVGVTGMEIRSRNNVFDGPTADRWNPDPTLLVIDPARIEERDAEMRFAYDSRALGDYRRVWGAEAQAVAGNVSLAGEYGKLETSTAGSAWERVLSRGAEAFLARAYVQYENFNVLALYRDYDLGYDNPYSRAFSEDGRYEQTILDGNAYRLRNPYWAQLGRRTAQPKPERGFFLSTRYQLNRQLTLAGLEYDVWTRQADDADMRRLTARVEYRPIFPVRLRARHSLTSRHSDRPDDIRNYESWDTRLELVANLSVDDQLRVLFSTSNVRYAARGRLSGPATGGEVQSDTTASRGSPGRALQGLVVHHFTDYFALALSGEVYDGFLYNYEDNEFIVVDGTGFRTWMMVRSRLSENLAWRLRWSQDHTLERTYVDIRDFGVLVPPTPDAVDARADRSSFRLQLDWSF
jgi:DNA uptake protein ComE-like DNA-binding protein